MGTLCKTRLCYFMNCNVFKFISSCLNHCFGAIYRKGGCYDSNWTALAPYLPPSPFLVCQQQSNNSHIHRESVLFLTPNKKERQHNNFDQQYGCVATETEFLLIGNEPQRSKYLSMFPIELLGVKTNPAKSARNLEVIFDKISPSAHIFL